MIRAVIIDDEVNGAEALRLLVEKYCSDKVSIDRICYSAKDGIEVLNEFTPDLVFLDIQMPHMNGFELLQKVTQRDFQLVFTTAYDDYAIQAFKVNAIDYLLKPIDPDDLRHAVDKARKNILNGKSSVSGLNKVLQEIKQQKYQVKKLAIPANDGVTFIEVDEIPKIEADSNYTTVFTITGRKYIVAKTLKDYEELLEEYNFLRVHSSTLINLKYVERYIRGDGGFIVLKDGSQVEVSRRKKQELVDRLNL